jgi:hypothetical protein
VEKRGKLRRITRRKTKNWSIKWRHGIKNLENRSVNRKRTETRRKRNGTGKERKRRKNRLQQ